MNRFAVGPDRFRQWLEVGRQRSDVGVEPSSQRRRVVVVGRMDEHVGRNPLTAPTRHLWDPLTPTVNRDSRIRGTDESDQWLRCRCDRTNRQPRLAFPGLAFQSGLRRHREKSSAVENHAVDTLAGQKIVQKAFV